MANINDFKAKLAGGGARANQFKVTMPFPGYAQVGGEIEDLAFLCTSTTIPAMTVGNVNVPFRGRQIKVAGDRTFAPWSITILNDTDFAIRNAMEEWMQTIAQYKDGSGATGPGEYMREATVSQLLRDPSATGATAGGGTNVNNIDEQAGQYRFYDIWPTNISAIDLSYDSSDVIEEFTVEFQVNYWAPLSKNNPD